MSKGTLFAFLQGAAIGVAVGILTAPRSGKKTRAWLEGEADAAKDILQGSLNQKMSELKALQDEVVEKASKTYNTNKSKINGALSKS